MSDAALKAWGWNAHFAGVWAEGDFAHLVPGRVVHVAHDISRVVSADGERLAEPTGRLHHRAVSRSERPVVGDWVALRPNPSGQQSVIESVLPRRSRLERKIPGDPTQSQVVAANVDIIFIVCALDGGRSFHARGLERFLALVRGSNAEPVVVLNKSDLCEDVQGAVKRAKGYVKDVPVLATSALTGAGMEKVRKRLSSASTAVLTGLSGVGKSAMLNWLAGEELYATGEVREKDLRGRHTTTARELIRLPDGGLVIDTPGLRELQLWVDEESLNEAFADIQELAGHCRFRDCRHAGEPGCAVQLAVTGGTLDPQRVKNFHSLKVELKQLQDRLHGRQLRDSRVQRASGRSSRGASERGDVHAND
jgi:ribosome biogenesis GTPase